MANEKEQKVTLRLEVSFERKVFKGDDGKENKYVQCVAEYCGENFRFSVKDKDARLFQYLMKMNGYALSDGNGNAIQES